MEFHKDPFMGEEQQMDRIMAVLEGWYMGQFSEKEMENFIGANLRIITQETVFQKTLRTVP